jgi:large repetitive protein
MLWTLRRTLSNPTNSGSQGNGDTATITYTAPATPPTPNSVTITATSVENPNSSGSDTFAISTALVVQTSNLSSGTVGAAYPSTNLQAAGGVSPYTWSTISGSVPDGMALSTSGTLSGTPTAAGTFNFTAQVNDSVGGSAAANLSFVVSAAQAVLGSISVGPQNFTILLTSNQQFDAVGQYADGSKQDITTTVAWQSSDNTVATVSAAGMVTAIGTGIATISAMSGQVQATTTLTVSPSTTGFTFVNDLTDSLLGIYQEGNGSYLTFLGTRDANGNPTSVYGIRSTAADGGWQEFLFDSQSRPYAINTSDGSQFSINWSSTANPVLQAVSSDLKTSASLQLSVNPVALSETTSASRRPAAMDLTFHVSPDTVSVKATCNGLPEDGATIYAMPDNFYSLSSNYPERAVNQGVGTGTYVSNLGSFLALGNSNTYLNNFAQAMAPVCQFLSEATPPGSAALNLAPWMCVTFLDPTLITSCEAVALSLKAVSTMCGILNAGDHGSVAWSIIVGTPISPDFVDIKVTGQLAGQQRTALLSKQPVGGPYGAVTLPDFNCSIAHISLVPASATISTVGTLPLTAFAIDSTSHIMLSSRFQWSWNSDNISFATVTPVSVAVPAGSPFVPPAPAVANVIGVSSGKANISVVEVTSGEGATAPINVVAGSCAATGTWHGSFSGSNGSSGEVSAFFAQSATSITGTVLIDDKKGIQTSSVTGTSSNGSVTVGPVTVDGATVSASGTFSSNCGSLSGSFVDNGSKAAVGSYSLTRW